MMAKTEGERGKERVGLARSSRVAIVSRMAGRSMHVVMAQFLLLLILLLLFLPNPSSAALPTFETLPPVTDHLKLPSGVAVGDDETIYVVESNLNQMHLFNKSGGYQRSLYGLDEPVAVAVGAAGEIYIANVGKGNVEVYGPDLSLVGKLGAGDGEFLKPVGVAVDSAGSIYVVDGREHRVKIYNADRSFKSSFGSRGTGNGQFQTPTSIAINEVTSEILIPDLVALSTSARVQVFDLNGAFLRSFITTGTNEQGETVAFIRPYGIAVDTLDRIYVTDGYQNVVTVYSTHGNYLGKLYDSNRLLRNPLGIAFAPGTSRLFVASLNSGTVETYGIDNVYGNIAASPPSHDFGTLAVNDAPVSQSFALSNDGSGDLAVGAITLTGADASGFSIIANDCAERTLTPAAGCTIDVQFQPLTAGSKSASLSVVSDDLYLSEMELALSGSANPQQYRLTISKNESTGATGVVQASGINCGTTCVAEYAEGTVVTLSALPNDDAVFVGWSGGGCSGTAACAVTMSQAVTVTATFDFMVTAFADPYSITASAGINGAISPDGIATYDAGASMTFTITADTGYTISDVLVNDGSVGAVGSYSFEDIGADHTITAEFTAISDTLLLSSIEMGEVSVDDQWKRVEFSKTFTDPVVVIKPASLNDSSPAVVRVRNVDAQGFEVRIQEWEYLLALLDNSAAHAEEQVGYLVLESGNYTLEDGTRVEAGWFDTNATSSFEAISFAQSFTAPPVVMSSIVTYNEAMAVTGRMGNVDTADFGYMLQEQGLNGQVHATERVSFIAWEPSQGTQSGISFEVGRVNGVLTQQPRVLGFSGSYQSPPLLIADLQTANGSGTINLRWSDKSATEVSLLLDQEQSNSTMTSLMSGNALVPPASSTQDVGYLILWSVEMLPQTLTVEKSGQGSGLVQSQAQDIDCGAACSSSYSHGTEVTLTAVAESDSFFAGWSGGGCSGTASCVVTLDQAVTVTAQFDAALPVTYTITATAGSNGRITPPGETVVNEGATQDYSIVADAGYHIADVTVNGESVGAEASYQFVDLDRNHEISATFAVNMHRLTVKKTGLGSGSVQAQGIDCGADCSSSYSHGAEVTLTAVAESDSFFASWSGGGCSGTASCVVTLDQAVTVTAQFDLIPTYTITATAGPNGSITPRGETVVNEGAAQNYSIVAAAGYYIADVTVNGESVGAEASYQFVDLDRNHEISATFAVNMHLLTVKKTGLGSGSVQAQGIDCGADCSSSYSHGTEVTLTVVAGSDSLFAGWSGGECSGTASCVVTLDQAVTVTAQFDLIPPVTYTITATAGPNGSITPQGETVVNEGAAQDYSVVADAGYHIANVIVDDEAKGIMDSFRFENIAASHSISVTFASSVFKLTDIAMGEVSVGHSWKPVTLDRFFADPIIVAKPASQNEVDPAVVRIRNVTTRGFELKIQEWEYLDGEHADEQVNYIVMERGNHVLKDGTRIEAGQFEASNTDAFETVLFVRPKAVPPVILSSVVSYNEEDAVTGRIREIDEEGFQYLLQEQAGSAAGHATETISYIAWEASIGRQDGISFEVSCRGNAEVQQFQNIEFISSYAPSLLFVADLQTAEGSDAVNLRWREKDKESIEVLIDQERSQPGESASASVEEIGYLVLSEQADSFCTSEPGSDCDRDGLTDEDEINIYGTDPYLANTDGDFWDDGREVNYWMGRWDHDDDNDGVINLLDFDSNGDGNFDGSAFAGNKSVKARGCGGAAALSKEGGKDGAANSRAFNREQRTFEKRRGFAAPNRTFEKQRGFAAPDRTFKQRSGFDSPAKGFDQDGTDRAFNRERRTFEKPRKFIAPGQTFQPRSEFRAPVTGFDRQIDFDGAMPY
ncbi:MAG: choice-of-anchor D domain-containing protein [Candidatus Polarisedimenticolaceae bacterium]|nr:choice-of-anchor D domain-containing protein [Candidatus Polarisedimenticolaceae bacterium]